MRRLQETKAYYSEPSKFLTKGKTVQKTVQTVKNFNKGQKANLRGQLHGSDTSTSKVLVITSLRHLIQARFFSFDEYTYDTVQFDNVC